MWGNDQIENKKVLKFLKNTGDLQGDKLIGSILDHAEKKNFLNQTEKIKQLFNLLIKNADLATVELPPGIRDYFQQALVMPKWVDRKKIKIAQSIFAKYGPEILLVLGFKSLPMSYACPAGAAVLVKTGRLNAQNDDFKNLSRRLLETSQFVIDVLSPGSFDLNGKGVVTARKIRLIHASIRFFLSKKGSKAGLVPINQKYELGTLMAFSALTLQGLEQLEINLSSEEKDAYIHIWNLVGFLMGLPEQHLPQDYKSAVLLGQMIFDSEMGSSQDGIDLTRALVRFYENILPGNLFDGLPETLIRFFLGDKISRYLGISLNSSLFDEMLSGLVRKILGLSDDIINGSSFIRKLVKRYSRKLMEGLIVSLNEGKQIHFYVPPSLTGNWNVSNNWQSEKIVLFNFFGIRLIIEKG